MFGGVVKLRRQTPQHFNEAIGQTSLRRSVLEMKNGKRKSR
jgi:hypothetical protein